MWGGDLYKELLLTKAYSWWDLKKSPGFMRLSGERVRPCKLSLHMKGLMSSCKKGEEKPPYSYLFCFIHILAAPREKKRLMSGLICSPLNSRQRFFTYLWSSWLLSAQPRSSAPSGIPLKPDQFTIWSRVKIYMSLYLNGSNSSFMH